MPKLRFDPVTYQFYYRCASHDGAAPKTAGFGSDPIRRRYFTEDPNVAASLESHGDFYASLLLTDVLAAVTSPQHRQRTRGLLERVPPEKGEHSLFQFATLISGNAGEPRTDGQGPICGENRQSGCYAKLTPREYIVSADSSCLMHQRSCIDCTGVPSKFFYSPRV